MSNCRIITLPLCAYLVVPPGGLRGEHEVEDENDGGTSVHGPRDVRVEVNDPRLYAVRLNDSRQSDQSVDKRDHEAY